MFFDTITCFAEMFVMVIICHGIVNQVTLSTSLVWFSGLLHHVFWHIVCHSIRCDFMSCVQLFT